MSKLVLLFLGTSVGLGLVSLHLVNELRTERDNTQALQARIEKLQAPTPQRAPPPAPTPIEAQEIAPPPPLAAPTPQPRRPAPTTSPAVAGFFAGPAPPVFTDPSNPGNMPSREERVRMMRESMERQRALLQNPEYREAMLLQQKAMLPRNYPDLDQELGMSAEEYDQLLTTLANQQLRGMDNQEPFVWDGTAPDQAAMERSRQKMQQQQQQNESELKALLGTEKYQAWRDYQSTMGVRHQVAQLRTTLATGGAPLQDDQVKPLLKAMADEQQRMMKEYQKEAQRSAARSGAATENRLMYAGSISIEQQEAQFERMKASHKRTRDAVSRILSSEQLRQWEREQNEQLQMQEAQMRMMRAQAQAAAERGDTAQQMPPGVAVSQGFMGSFAAPGVMLTPAQPVAPTSSSSSSR